MKLNYTLEARLEVMEAVTWYFEQEKELAAEFDHELREAEKSIVEFPEFWSPLDGGYHRYHLKRFPYSVVYQIESREFVVVAVAAHKRRKDYWRKRGK